PADKEIQVLNLVTSRRPPAGATHSKRVRGDPSLLERACWPEVRCVGKWVSGMPQQAQLEEITQIRGERAIQPDMVHVLGPAHRLEALGHISRPFTDRLGKSSEHC